MIYRYPYSLGDTELFILFVYFFSLKVVFERRLVTHVLLIILISCCLVNVTCIKTYTVYIFTIFHYTRIRIKKMYVYVYICISCGYEKNKKVVVVQLYHLLLF